MKIMADVHVINDNKMIYKIESMRELSSNEYVLLYSLELVAGYDYINPDESDVQGYVSAENFTEGVQSEDVTVFLLTESLGERLEDEGYKIIKIEDYTIHEGPSGKEKVSSSEAVALMLKGGCVELGERYYMYNPKTEKLRYSDYGQRNWKDSANTIEEFARNNKEMLNVIS